MLTRLKVSGFKNLVDVDVHLGPFTCIAGANGTGKSNLFDAVRFLSALANHSLIEAALTIRDEGGRTTDVRSLFHRVGDRYDNQVSFEVEMLIPAKGLDDLGQEAKASVTFLCYKLTLAYRAENGLGNLELMQEELKHINQTDAQKHLLFPHNREWRKSVVLGKRGKYPLISTEGEGKDRIIKLHQDGGSGGRPLISRLATHQPRTMLSSVNSAESPTVLLARREMQAWFLLQLEPSSLRNSDSFMAPTKLGMDGSHMARTLYRLAQQCSSESTYAQLANKLAELLEDVYELRIDRDEKRDILSLQVMDKDHTWHPARSLSDGTLRFLALAVLELDPDFQGVLCLEEPENGIHPQRIHAMLKLLHDICTDVDSPVAEDNPLRQVIVNTHSPSVVNQVPDDSLLVSHLKETVRDMGRCKRACFGYLPDTWRDKKLTDKNIINKGGLLAYLSPTGMETPESNVRRVQDRDDIKALRQNCFNFEA